MRKIPVKEELKKASNKVVSDIIKQDLKLLFCGINPGLFSAYSGYHFARPGNRFWKTLYQAGFTDHVFDPSEQQMLLQSGYGITNIVDRPSVSAAELTVEEYIEGGKKLVEKLSIYKPRWVAFVGVEAYRKAFGKPKAIVGNQNENIKGVSVWVLPSPSGLNAHYSLAQLVSLFKELRTVIE